MTWQGKKRERTFENVKRFWEKSGKAEPANPNITIRDHYFRLLEIEEIRKLIKGKGNVLDIGCGNGYSTLQYAQDVDSIIGCDYSKNLIAGAKTLLQKSSLQNVEFKVADVLNLPFEKEEFEVVIGERLLINLPDWNLQKKAVREIARVLKKDGLYICVEVTKQGHEKVDYYRRMFDLDILEKYWHNLYLDESRYLPFVNKHFSVCEVKRFGMYQFITKIMHPLLAAPEQPKFISKFNRIAMEIGKKITNFDDCSHQVMFVLYKK